MMFDAHYQDGLWNAFTCLRYHSDWVAKKEGETYSFLYLWDKGEYVLHASVTDYTRPVREFWYVTETGEKVDWLVTVGEDSLWDAMDHIKYFFGVGDKVA